MRRAAVLLTLSLLACDRGAKDAAPLDSEAVAGDAAVTWHRDIRPVAARSCNGCHAEGQIAPFSFEDWSEVAVLGAAMVASVEDGSMPPYAFDQSCRETSDNVQLSGEEVALFQAWRDAGFPEGDAADYVAPARAPVVEYPPFDVEIRPLEPMEVDLTRADDYRCLVTDTVFEEDTWLVGEQALIDNAEIVHHLIYYTVPAAAEAELLALDARSEAPGIPCYQPDGYGFWGLEGLDSFGGWAPGYQTWYQPQDSGEPVSGTFVEAGSRVVIEGHFNSLTTDAASMTDNTGVGLWTLPAGEVPDLVLQGDEVSDYQLDIPAGAEAHVEGGSLRVNRARTLVSVNPHMHMLGTKMEANIIRADGGEECLTRVDPYDFNWQWSYTFTEPVELQRGDRIEMTCHYDNSAANQPVVDGAQQAPRDVSYGDGTTDEMCIHYLTYAVPYEVWAAAP